MQLIGDIGINHNGSIGAAVSIMRMAETYGFDVVKFQKRNPDICIPENQKETIKETIFGRIPYIDYKHKIEFGKKEYNMIDNEARRMGIKWTASVWDIDSLNFIMEYNVPFIKIPSACITDLNLLKACSDTGKDIVISTGMSTEEEIITAVNVIGKENIGILHCNSSYPSKAKEADLRYITTLKEMYPEHRIGYSSHAKTAMESIIALSLGAEILEVHITNDKKAKGTDHAASFDEEGIKTLTNMLKTTEVALGSNKKTVYPSELENKKKLRRY